MWDQRYCDLKYAYGTKPNEFLPSNKLTHILNWSNHTFVADASIVKVLIPFIPYQIFIIINSF